MVVDDRAVASPVPGRPLGGLDLRVEEVTALDAQNRVLVDDHVFLIGRPALRGFIAFVKSLSVDGVHADVRALADQWRAGREEVLKRERTESGIADGAEVRPLPAHLEHLRQATLEDPIFGNGFNVVPTEIGMVELDRLVVYQKHIDLGFVRDLVERIGRNPSDETVYRTCIPFDHPKPPVKWIRSQPTTWLFASPSNDLRFLGSVLLEPHQITGHPPLGNAAGTVGLTVGFGSNFLNAIAVENRIVLNNGSHRAYAMRQLGVTHVPCIVQRAGNREELRAIASSDLKRNPDLYLRQPRPSMLRDYFDPALRAIVPCVRRVRQVRVRFMIENDEAPAF